MKQFFFIAIILALFTFASCKKSDQNSDQKSPQQQTQETKAPRKKGGKKAAMAAGLQIYQDDKLVATVAHNEYAGLTTTDVKIDGKNYKAVLLSDLLKKYNLKGKTVTLQGPAKQCSISWEQATANPIYVYIGKNRLQLYTESKNLETVKLPQVVIKITTGEQAPPAPLESPASAKGQKKTS
jgi:hypothetical protein